MPGAITDFGKLFQFLMQLSVERAFHLIIDEFQEFFNINPAIYSVLQRCWDLTREHSRMNLLVCGSVQSMMHKIFKDYKAPLFGRATSFMQVRPFRVSALKEILQSNNPAFSSEDLLAFYAFTGGVAKYVQLLVENNALSFGKMLDFIIREDSPFITDGKNMLIEEFGKDYAIYFTVLSAIARGENTRGKIEVYVGKEISGYLTRLERDYSLITKKIPIFAKNETKNVRYIIEDNFLSFWFRFIYKYEHIIEISQYQWLKQIVERDYATYSEIILEKYFREQLIEQGQFTEIGNFWDKTGENEIDIVAVNELERVALIAEVKRNEKHIRYNTLKTKAETMINKTGRLNNYTITYKGLSMTDM
jgi:AAA+ ATPase superfamily predicted ATPase